MLQTKRHECAQSVNILNKQCNAAFECSRRGQAWSLAKTTALGIKHPMTDVTQSITASNQKIINAGIDFVQQEASHDEAKKTLAAAKSEKTILEEKLKNLKKELVDVREHHKKETLETLEDEVAQREKACEAAHNTQPNCKEQKAEGQMCFVLHGTL